MAATVGACVVHHPHSEGATILACSGFREYPRALAEQRLHVWRGR